MSENVESIKIDDAVIERLKIWIIVQEGKNLKNHEKNDQQMVALIKKRIEEEAQCCLNQ